LKAFHVKPSMTSQLPSCIFLQVVSSCLLENKKLPETTQGVERKCDLCLDSTSTLLMSQKLDNRLPYKVLVSSFVSGPRTRRT